MFPRLLALLLCLAVSPVHAWWSCEWQQRFTVEFDFSPGRPHNDLTVQVDLNSGNVPAGFDWSTGGNDLRVIDEDDQTELPFLIGSWDSVASTATIWVQIDVPGGFWGRDREIFFYFDGPPGAVSGSSLTTFPEPGMKFHTKRSTANPNNRAQAEAAFASGQEVNGYGCTWVSSYTNVSNQSLFNPDRDSDIALFAEVYFEVAANEVGTWEFRYGADFGLGGGLYVDGQTLEEDWVNDLWWNYDWGASSEVLQGSIFLAEGAHSLSILGFEDCCDGGLTVQFRRPGGPWQDLALSNIDLRARECGDEDVQPVVSTGPGELGDCPSVSVSRVSQPIADPVSGSLDPRAIPNAIMLNTIELQNAGIGEVDDDSIVITEAIDPEAALIVQDFDGSTNGPVLFVDGTPSSGLIYNFASLGSITDDLSFSNNGGASFNYTPTAGSGGVDSNVTHIRIEPSSPFAGNGGSGVTSAQFQFKTRIQ